MSTESQKVQNIGFKDLNGGILFDKFGIERKWLQATGRSRVVKKVQIP